MDRVHLIVTADGRRAALFACRRSPEGRLKLEQLGSIQNRHEAEHERGRPALLGGMERPGAVSRSGAHAAPHTASAGRAQEEGRARFAREIGRWLEEASAGYGDAPTTVFAPARFLGLLRDQIDSPGNVRTREAGLTRLSIQELAGHPAVLGAVRGRGAKEGAS